MGTPATSVIKKNGRIVIISSVGRDGFMHAFGIEFLDAIKKVLLKYGYKGTEQLLDRFQIVSKKEAKRRLILWKTPTSPHYLSLLEMLERGWAEKNHDYETDGWCYTLDADEMTIGPGAVVEVKKSGGMTSYHYHDSPICHFNKIKKVYLDDRMGPKHYHWTYDSDSESDSVSDSESEKIPEVGSPIPKMIDYGSECYSDHTDDEYESEDSSDEE